ncbi:hypothetical protein DFQ27_009840 [Actinomortierella ambigua]|uniref:C2H2-type domain-containing protein n=1 Tax=Actinomortierella ambigua TaxID=1343610 RepID=A0A9P6PNV7_9FUNG|nr:hypothetical protein DFQ27_009840 [Actinomortierella ambigua]
MTNPTLVHISYTCYLCTTATKIFNTPFNLRRHLVQDHQVTVPSRQPGERMKNTRSVTYLMSTPQVPRPDMIEHVACPSCCFSCEKLIDLKEHVKSNHIHDADQPLEDDDDSEQAKKRAKQRQSVSIVSEKQIYTFSAALDLPPTNCLKMPDNAFVKLQEIMTILYPTNKNLNLEQRALVDEELAAQQSLSTLKGFKTAFKFLGEALKQPYTEMPSFLWRLPPASQGLSEEETQFIRVIQFVLTDFSAKCYRDPAFVAKSERTFWVDRVVPIFQQLADQTRLLGFEWCETAAVDLQETSISSSTWRSTSPIQYLDGRGYDCEARSWITLEASSGQHKEKVEHTVNDTIKNAYNAIALVKTMVRRYQHSRFTTMTRFLAFTVQSVRRTLTLTTTHLDPENPGSFIVQQRRVADVPTTYSQRGDWLKVFEMVAFLLKAMGKQSEVLEELAQECSGELEVAPADYTCSLLCEK